MASFQGTQEDRLSQDNLANLRSLFIDQSRLSRALTHRSYLNEHPESLEDNERLEFLGDAVLDFLVGAWLYNRFPEMAEGNLTRLRAALVGNDQLADFARQIELGQAMLLGRGEDENGGRERSALLGSTFEALIGAIYLDRGLAVVQTYIEPFLEAACNQIMLGRKDHDPKSLLQEWAQSQGFGTPYYRTISADGPDHEKTFVVDVVIQDIVYGSGVGPSKQAAAKAAAKSAIADLGIE